MTDLFITLSVLILLIAMNALYVLAEFSTVSSRKARLTQMVEDGSPFANSVLKIIDDPEKLDTYVATSQVGITISSLVLGYFGQARLSGYLAPLLSSLGNFSEPAALSVSATIILITLTLAQVLFGELIPKNLGIQEPERYANLTYRPLRWSDIIFKPLIWLFNGSGILLLRIFKIEPSSEHGHIHSPEEISILIDESGKGGAISDKEYNLLKNTMRMRDANIKRIMIPRAQMLAIPENFSVHQATEILLNSPYSRLPVYASSIDTIIGIIHFRDLFCAQNDSENTEQHKLADLIRPVQLLPGNLQIKEVLSLLQQSQHQVAIILDEFGGTSGLVTVEDIIEEIFGDLQDEFDDESPAYQELPDERILLSGNALIFEINESLSLRLPEDIADTVSGLLVSEIGRIPLKGDEISIDGNHFTVQEMENKVVSKALLKRRTTSGDVGSKLP